MRLECPNHKTHDRFGVTAHVTQTWEVDSEGDFKKEISSCDEITHFPNKDSIFTCTICGTEAIIS